MPIRRKSFQMLTIAFVMNKIRHKIALFLLSTLTLLGCSFATAASPTYRFQVVIPGLHPTASVAASDPYWAYVTMLASFDGVSGATSFPDAKGNTLTPIGSPVLSGLGPYGQGTSLYLNGSSALTVSGKSGFVLSGDFTAEMWVKYSAHATYGGLLAYAANCSSTFTGWQIIFDQTTNNLRLEVPPAIPLLVSTSAVPANTWAHIALVRHGTGTNNVTFYINGNPAGSATDNTTWNGGTSPVYLGVERCGSGYTTGYFADVRMTQGVARYTGPFTPPASDFPTQ